MFSQNLDGDYYHSGLQLYRMTSLTFLFTFLMNICFLMEEDSLDGSFDIFVDKKEKA